MSVRVMTKVWDINLPDSDKIVLLALADCANDEGHCWPGIPSLVRKCSKTDRTIQAAIKRLCDEGHLTRREVPGKGCNYTVHPRSDCTPEVTSPPKGTTGTPEAASGKPSLTVITEAKAPVERVIEAWNEMAEKTGLHKVRILDNSRKQMLRLRLKAMGLDTMLEAVKLAGRSPFLTGKTGDGRKADINIILQPKTLSRVLEGFYGEDEKGHSLTDAERIENLRSMIPLYEQWNRPDDAEDCRRRIAALEKPPDPAMAARAGNLIGNVAKARAA